MEEYDRVTQYFEVAGNDRTAQPGRIFKLAGHFSAIPKLPLPGEERKPGKGLRDYLIVSVVHTASNNYPAGASAKSKYSNTFTCVRRDIRWRPGRGHNSTPCKNPGVQTAIVVGPPGEDVHTDELGRVKLQFHWDRQGKFDQASSPWVRVMMPMAGSYFGQMCLPRVGQEVVVQFLDGNVDRPIVVGVVYNRKNMPPWHLPAQRALPGLRSREFGDPDGGSNHLILDDTKGGMQVQLKSDHECSQLSLGSITRIETSEGRQDVRGEGWELGTNAWGVARASKGMLITTEKRLNAAGNSKELSETSCRLDAAQKLHRELAGVATQYKAQIDNEQIAVAQELSIQNAGIAGSGTGATFPELRDPHLVLASPTGIALAAGENIHLASEKHTAVTAADDISLVSGGSLFASIRQAIKLFAHRAGIRMIAAAGHIDIRTLSDSINLMSKLDIVQSADKIIINARQEVLINAGGSSVKIYGGGIECGTQGEFHVHASRHIFDGAKGAAHEVDEVASRDSVRTMLRENDEEEIVSQQFSLLDDEGRPVEGFSYDIFVSGERRVRAASFSSGRTERIEGSAPAELVFWLDLDGGFPYV